MKRSIGIRLFRRKAKTGKLKAIGSAIINSRDFSDVEDNELAFKDALKMFKNAGRAAAIEAKVAGVSRAYFKNNAVVIIDKEGKETFVEPVVKREKYFVKHIPKVNASEK